MNRDNELLGLYQFSLTINGTTVLQPVDFSIRAHQVYLIAGWDEDNNVMLLKAMAGLLPYRYIQGQVLFEGINIYDAVEKEMDDIRKKTAFVFSDGTLIANLTVEENLLLPMRYHFPHYDFQAVMERIKRYFDFFKIPDVLTQRPAALTYCTKKRLSFIRAALLEPELIIMDKPLFNLDSHAQERVIAFLEELKQHGTTFLLVSQSPHQLDGFFDETIILEEGRINPA